MMSALSASAGGGGAQPGGATPSAAAPHPTTTTNTKKFQKLDINSMYCVNRCESLEPVSMRSTLSRKHGMQSLGKVPSARRPPANLPSLRTETAAASASNATTGVPVPVPTTPPVNEAGCGPPSIPTSSAPTGPVSNAHTAAGWGSLPPPTSAHFKQEFPSLGGDPGAQVPAGPQGAVQPGINASLRPHAEGSWSAGGGGGSGNRSDLSPSPAATAPPTAPAPGTAAYRAIIPSFMMKDSSAGGAASANTPSNTGSAPSRQPPENRERERDSAQSARGGPLPHHQPAHRHQPRAAEPLQHRPILRTEQLNSLDDIARDAGWAVHDTIDYNQKLTFPDDESDRLGAGGRDGRQTESRDASKEPSAPRERENINSVSVASHLPTDEDLWAARQRHQSIEIAAAVRRANQRKEDEERRFQQEHRKTLILPEWEKAKDSNKEYNRDSQRDQRDIRERERDRERDFKDREFRDGGNRENQENRNSRESGEPKDNRDKSRDSTRDVREPKETRESRETRDGREFRDGRDHRDGRESRDDFRFKAGRGDQPAGQGGNASNFKGYQSNLPPRFLKQRQEQDKENSGGNNGQGQQVNHSNKSPGFVESLDPRWTFPAGKSSSGGAKGGGGSRGGGPPPPTAPPPTADRGALANRKPFTREYDESSSYGGRWDNREMNRSGSYDWRSAGSNNSVGSAGSGNAAEERPSTEDWKDKETSPAEHKTSAAERLSEVFDRKITQAEQEAQSKRITPERGTSDREATPTAEPALAPLQPPAPPALPAPPVSTPPADTPPLSHKDLNKSDSEDSKRSYPLKKPLSNVNIQKDKAKSIEPDSNIDLERYPHNDHRAKSQEIELDSNKIADICSQERKDVTKSSSCWTDASVDKNKDTFPIIDTGKDFDCRSERKLSSSGSEKRSGRNRLDSGGSKASSGRSYGSYPTFNNRNNWSTSGGPGGAGGGGGGRRGPNNATGGNRSGPRQAHWGPASESDNSAEETNKDRRELSHKRRSGRSPRNGRRHKEKDDKGKQHSMQTMTPISAPISALITEPVTAPVSTAGPVSSTIPTGNANVSSLSPQVMSTSAVTVTVSDQVSVTSVSVTPSGGQTVITTTAERNEAAFAPRGEPSRRGRGGGGAGSHRGGGRHAPPVSTASSAALTSAVSVPSNLASAPTAASKHRVDGYGLPSVKSPFGGQSSVDESKLSNADVGRTDEKLDQKQQSQTGHTVASGSGRGQRSGRRGVRDDDEVWENSETSERDSGAEGGNQGRGGRRRGGHSGRGPPRSRRLDEESSKADEFKSKTKEDSQMDRNHKEDGFQEVRNKKNVKDQRNTLQRDDAKKVHPNQRPDSTSRTEKSVNGTAGKANGPLSASTGSQKNDGRSQSYDSRTRSMHIAPRFAKMYQNQMQNIVDVSVPQSTQAGVTPQPVPSINAWDKPISRTLRGDPDGDGPIAETAPDTIAPDTDSPAKLNQRSTPAGETRACTGNLDGTTPPVQTIIFENTNFKSAPDALKPKYQTGLTSPRPAPERAASVELEARLLGFERPDLQLTEDSSDMKLDFAFDSDLSQLGEDKTAKALGLSRSMHSIQQTTISPSAAELNLKIASVKKVWETAPSLPTVSEHSCTNVNVAPPRASTPGGSSAVDLQMLQHSEYAGRAHRHRDTAGTSPAGQGGSTAAPLSGDHTVHQQTNVCKVKPTQQQAAQQQAAQQQQQAAQQTLLAAAGGNGVSPPPALHYGGGVAGVVPYGGLSVPSPPSAAAAAAAVLFNSSQYAFPLDQQRATQFNAFAPPFSSIYQPPPDPVYQYRLGTSVGGSVSNTGVGVSGLGVGVGVGGSMMLSSHSHAQQPPPSTAALLQAKQQQQQQQIGAIGSKAAVASGASAVSSYQYLAATGFGTSGAPPTPHQQPPPAPQHHQQLGPEQYVVHRPPPTYTAYGAAPPSAAPPPAPPQAPPHTATFYQQQASAYGLQYPQQQQLAASQFLAAAAATGSPQTLQIAMQQMQQQQHALYDLSGQKYSSNSLGAMSSVGAVGSVGGIGASIGGAIAAMGGSGGAGGGRHLPSHSTLYQQQLKHQQIKSPPTHQECIFGVPPSPSPKPLGSGVGSIGQQGGLPPPHSPPHKYHHNMQQQNGRHGVGGQVQQSSVSQQQRYPAPIQRPPQYRPLTPSDEYSRGVAPGTGMQAQQQQRHHRPLQHYYHHTPPPAPSAHITHAAHHSHHQQHHARHPNGDRAVMGTGAAETVGPSAVEGSANGDGARGQAADGASPGAQPEAARPAPDN